MFENRCKVSNYKAELQHYSTTALQPYSDLAGQPKNRGSIPFGVFFKASRSTGVPSFLLSLGTAELFVGDNRKEAHIRSVQQFRRCAAEHTFLVLIHGVVLQISAATNLH
jgi:hypothetical protein